MKPATVLALVTAALILTREIGGAGTKLDSLRTVSNRVAKSLLAANWTAFRKDAAATIVIEERWTAYRDYFDKSVRFVRGDDGALGPADFKAISFFSTISNTPKLSPKHGKTFLGFCKMVKESREYSGPSWEWPVVTGDGIVTGLDHGDFVGPSAGGGIASNEYWCVEFAKVDGKWKARRLILGGH